MGRRGRGACNEEIDAYLAPLIFSAFLFLFLFRTEDSIIKKVPAKTTRVWVLRIALVVQSLL